jgi:ABC-2 type transport system permease protein
LKNKLFLLTKVNITSVLNPAKAFGKSDSATEKKKVFSTILFTFLGIYLGVTVAGMTSLLYEGFKDTGLVILVPALFFIGASFMIVVTCLFAAQGYLFGAKDLEMLFSFPVSHRDIIISKFLMLYFYDLMFSVLIFGVSGVVYCVLSSAGIMGWITIILGVFIVPLLPLCVGTIISYGLGLALRKVKRKNVVTTVLSLIFSLIIILFYSMSSFTEYIVSHGQNLLEGIKSYYLPAGWLLGSLNGDILNFLLFALINILPVVIILPLLAKRFASIVASFKSSATKANYKFRSQKKDNKLSTCFKKEMKRILSSSVYILNSGVGIIMLLVYTITLFRSSGAEAGMIITEWAYAPLVAIFALIFCSTLNTTTCCSISLEAKTFWIYKTSPVDEKTIFEAKALANEMLYIPFIIVLGILYTVILKLGIEYALLLIVIPVIALVCASYFGLIVNLAFPKLKWQNETQVIKQSASVVISMFSSMGFNGLMIVLSIVALNNLAISIFEVMLCLLVIYLLLMVFLEYILRTWGVKKFKSLY